METEIVWLVSRLEKFILGNGSAWMDESGKGCGGADQGPGRRRRQWALMTQRSLLCGRGRRRCLVGLLMRGRFSPHVDLVACLHDDEQRQRCKRNECQSDFPHCLSPSYPLKN
jgi:hypothetical protein